MRSPTARDAWDPCSTCLCNSPVHLRRGCAPLAAATARDRSFQALLPAVLSLRSSSNLARCKWNHRAARAWASCPTWCATSDGGGRPSINFSEVCGPLAQPTTVPAVALGAAGSRAASGTHVHPSCRVQLMAALASSTFATVELLRESAAVSRKQPRRAGVLGSTFEGTQLGLNARSFTARKKTRVRPRFRAWRTL